MVHRWEGMGMNEADRRAVSLAPLSAAAGVKPDDRVGIWAWAPVPL